MVSDLVIIRARLAEAEGDLACRPVQSQWFRLINTGTLAHRIILQCITLYCTVLYCIVLCCTMLYCTVLYYKTIHYTTPLNTSQHYTTPRLYSTIPIPRWIPYSTFYQTICAPIIIYHHLISSTHTININSLLLIN